MVYLAVQDEEGGSCVSIPHAHCAISAPCEQSHWRGGGCSDTVAGSGVGQWDGSQTYRTRSSLWFSSSSSKISRKRCKGNISNGAHLARAYEKELCV